MAHQAAQGPDFGQVGLLALRWLLALGASLLSAVSEIVWLLLLLMAIDSVIAIALAWRDGVITPTAAFRGGIRKGVVLALILMAWVLQRALALMGVEIVLPQFGSHQVMIAEAVAVWFIWHELTSILGHARRSGVPLPPFLEAAVARLKPVPPLAGREEERPS